MRLRKDKREENDDWNQNLKMQSRLIEIKVPNTCSRSRQVGTCWSFSTVANIEGITFLATNNSIKQLRSIWWIVMVQLTMMQIVRIVVSLAAGHTSISILNWKRRNFFGRGRYTAGTGDCYPCMKGPEKLCGPPPYYCDRDRTLKICEDPNLRFSAKIKDWKFIDSDEKAMTDVLQEVGS